MNLLIIWLNRIALSAMQRSEVVGAVIVMSIVFMMIIPLPTGLIDVLIALNICVSSLLIVLAMYLPKPLAFSTFPAVLLLTTMFRLAISISTTRQILLQQDGGHIVEAFGNYVVGGNLAVGLVIFLILTVVNFLVITKGSERVAEVAARFTLDAMPGKQMSIDSDLRAGLIEAHQARQRRENLAKESQLFGAMDGAMKFVKGDAIASLVIVFINMIGGFAIGVLQHNMAASDAMHVYSVLTIGDGLIAQIPALLISLTAGMIITRVSADGQKVDANIGREIAEQLTSQPKAWIISSIGMFGFALLPGMPTLVFVAISVSSLGSGLFQLWRIKQQGQLDASQLEADNIPAEQNGYQDLRRFNPTRAYLLLFHPVWQGQPTATALVQNIRRLRNRLVYRFGFTLPSFDIEFSDRLAEDEFQFCVYEIPYVKATLVTDQLAVANNAIELADATIATSGHTLRDESQWLWLPLAHVAQQPDDVPRWTADELILARMEQAIHRTGSQFIGLQETKSILAWLESEQPELAQELQRIMPLSRFASVLQRLASERVPLRSVRPIAEALIEVGQHERDTLALTDYVRLALKSQICHQYSDENSLAVWLLTPESEELLRDALRQTQNETFFALTQDYASTLLGQLRRAFPPFSSQRSLVLVAQDLRSPLRTLLQDEFHHVPVLSFTELESTLSINVIGRLDLYDSPDPFSA
ncbi:EscV/YscV/HrcV family type III secretion system export apparatus protein [Pectobacterium punjabense]|uniref:EscV/YscV/HrcV family type III secretion system export apparatus protein n=1 Tax=Pectobacterium punjabense TaxID=2108399 RepID=A0ABX6L2K9_9GAMM|nr:type III secretion system export apparatus subunit SctV [Pectobacterium punjabense]MBS4431925.1 type III secretion system export apparatus subunit SctV [Pectobacterium punjabense]MBT9183179.1 type III secretion system export apparatus subunit SctV [Pectobacterium punjabense]PTA63939.1 EscV/YscV/HrcV family type III secretion system export apparatus protein [Pectobacterium punjabense]QJA20524.1 EscV/YscV/HrcV family type III secretion system export apparatus protein [Pectobacterium punjabense